RAKGGAAMVGIESAPIHPCTWQFAQQMRLWEDRVVPGLKACADAVHAAGSKVSIILWHGGHNISHYATSQFNGLVPLAPSPVPSPVTGDVPKAMSRADIADMIAAYRAAARRCVAAGIDCIEVQTSSDYLLGSFLSPKLNRRTDEYGGTLENRARFVVEVLQAVRAEAGPNTAVGVRTCIEHIIPSDPGGYGPAESLAAMKHLDSRGLVDWVSLMTGSHWDFSEMISPMNYPRAQLAEQAAAFKRALSVPVIVAGRIRTPAEAEAIIAKGQADVVAMARTFIAEPDWGVKAIRGEVDRIRPCMSCNQGCLGIVHRAQPGGCVLNAAAGREHELTAPARATRSIRVAVIGGGPAGLECARIAAERGQAVTLYEADSKLGGAFRLAAEAPHRGEMKLPLAWWERELARLGVSVNLDARIDAGAQPPADKVVWAIGAVPAPTMIWRTRPSLVNGIPGSAGLPHGRDVLAGRAQVRGRVLVVDEEGGWPAISTVETIAARSGVTAVTLASSAAVFGQPDLHFSEETRPVAARLKAAGVSVRAGTLIARIDGAHALTTGGEQLGPFDSIVLSTGAASYPVPEGALAIGDCVTPRTFWAAVQDGARLGRML
ncbi:MAG: FAD-dependent oxidoreductase, partial [Rhodospirillaceae bacterium]|nr:FAD-dependent oxidoreductase [Rhodospirillaceae bacterium]